MTPRYGGRGTGVRLIQRHEDGPTVHTTVSALASERCPAFPSPCSKPHSRGKTSPAQADDVLLMGPGAPPRRSGPQEMPLSWAVIGPVPARHAEHSLLGNVVFSFADSSGGAVSERVFSGRVASDPLQRVGSRGGGEAIPVPPGEGEARRRGTPLAIRTRGHQAFGSAGDFPRAPYLRRCLWTEDGCSRGDGTGGPGRRKPPPTRPPLRALLWASATRCGALTRGSGPGAGGAACEPRSWGGRP